MIPGGFFVVVESQDGGGKGTMAARLVHYYRAVYGDDMVVETKDPGGTPLGTEVRKVLFETVGTKNMAIGVVDCLFLASHLQNWQTVVQPALAQGKIVITDRWFYSQGAYATEREVPAPLAEAYEKCHGGPADLLLFLHGDSNILLARANSRTDETHQETKAWNDAQVQQRVKEAYIRLYSNNPEFRSICVDGKSVEEVWRETLGTTREALTAKLTGAKQCSSTS